MVCSFSVCLKASFQRQSNLHPYWLHQLFLVTPRAKAQSATATQSLAEYFSITNLLGGSLSPPLGFCPPRNGGNRTHFSATLARARTEGGYKTIENLGGVSLRECCKHDLSSLRRDDY